MTLAHVSLPPPIPSPSPGFIPSFFLLTNTFSLRPAKKGHWVIYASVNKTEAPAVVSPSSGEVLRPRRSTHISLPIGTIRLVPFPHPPHPKNGGVYVDGELTNAGDPIPASPPSLPATVTAAAAADQQFPFQTTTTTTNGNSNTTTITSPSSPDGPPETVDPLTLSESMRASTPSYLPFATDRRTSLHDGQEPYVKLGRLAVLKEFRRAGIAGQLVRAATQWMQENYVIFNPRPSTVGFERLGMDERNGVLPKWRGLICVHAQEAAVPMWERYGFEVDHEMGTWYEEGIPHVGMFRRVKVGDGGHVEFGSTGTDL